MQACPGYQGFRRVQDKDPVTDKPGDSAYVRDTKFSAMGARVVAGGRSAVPSTITSTSTSFVRPTDYKVPHKLGVMAGRAAQLPKPVKFIGRSMSSMTHADFRGQLKVLESKSEAELRDIFSRFDVDRSGYIEGREILTVVAALYGTDEAEDRAVRLFRAHFDSNKDGKISWDEFKAGVAAVTTAMQVENRTNPRLRGPGWVSEKVPEVIGPGERKSAAMVDVGVDGDDPRKRKLTEGSGMASTTGDLFEGTSKRTLQLPGYGGFIPQAVMGKKFAGNGVDQASGVRARDTFHAKTNLTLTVGSGLPGYTGHAPTAAQHAYLERNLSGTEKLSADQPIIDYWATRNAAAGSGRA